MAAYTGDELNVLSLVFVNFCILVTFSFLGSSTYTAQEQRPSTRQAVRYLIAVTAGLALLAYAAPLISGVRVDLRYVPIAIAGLLGGPVAAFAVALPLMVYRFWIGGVGAPAGMLGLLLCALVAYALSQRFRNRTVSLSHLWAAPMLFAVVDLTVLLIPGQGTELFQKFYFPSILLNSAGLLLSLAVFDTRFRLIGKTLSFERLAYLDSLTGALNRRAFDRDLQHQESETYLVLLDLDHFKSINDLHGHPFGDQVLMQLKNVLHEIVRTHDRIYRVGGEEFAVLLKATDLAEARQVAERIRQTVAAQLAARLGCADLYITVSLGVTAWHGSAAQTFEAADKLMYQAKHQGRNRVLANSRQ